MKKLIIILIIQILQGNETILKIEKKEFQTNIINSTLDGITGTLSEAYKLITNPPNINREKYLKQQECNKKYWKLHKKSTKYWWILYYENSKIKKELSKRKINYNIILKQKIKKPKINLIKLKKESCSKNYFDLYLKRKKEDNKITQENKILKELAKANNINIKLRKDLYKQIEIQKNNKKEKEHQKAKEDLKKELKSAIETVK